MGGKSRFCSRSRADRTKSVSKCLVFIFVWCFALLTAKAAEALGNNKPPVFRQQSNRHLNDSAPQTVHLGSQAPWMDDGSGVFEYPNIDDKDMGIIRCIANDTRSSTPFNALYQGNGGMVSGRHLWSFIIEFDDHSKASSKGFSVGVTDPSHLLTSYQVRGLYFNGDNLSDGRALLRSNYGDASHHHEMHPLSYTLLPQVLIFMYVEFTSGRVQIRFVQDMKPLGIAFDIPAGDLPLPLFPAVTFRGGGATAKIKKIPEDILPFPQILEERRDLYVSSHDPFLGNWKRSSAEGEPLLISQGRAGLHQPKLTETEGGDGEEEVIYSLSTRVVNNLIMQMTCRKPKESVSVDSKAEEGSKIKGRVEGCSAGVVASTRMMVPPEMMKAEKEVEEFLRSIESMTVYGGKDVDDTLVINKVGSESTKLLRYHVPFSPVTDSPFKRTPQESRPTPEDAKGVDTNINGEIVTK